MAVIRCDEAPTGVTVWYANPMTTPPTSSHAGAHAASTAAGSFFADVYDTATSMVSHETLSSFAQDVRGGLETGLEAAREITARASAFAERSGVTSEALDALLRRQRAEEVRDRAACGDLKRLFCDDLVLRVWSA